MTEHEIDFNAAADLRKWPSLRNERMPHALGPYMVYDGTLDECIRRFVTRPASTHHLYEIYTEPQGELISSVLSAEHIVELARLRDFL
jgi:hypothetical protein